jgi:ElaB/YqjD/DUF883 family membrane-anchored ribosome-binding protein
MGQDQGEAGAQQLASDPDERAQQLRAEIEETRQDLGDTAAELVAKTDVKARAREKLEQVKRSTAEKKDELLSKAGRSSDPDSASDSGGRSGAAVAQLKRRAQEHPVPTAAAGALVGGFLLGRLTSRRDD